MQQRSVYNGIISHPPKRDSPIDLHRRTHSSTLRRSLSFHLSHRSFPFPSQTINQNSFATLSTVPLPCASHSRPTLKTLPPKGWVREFCTEVVLTYFSGFFFRFFFSPLMDVDGLTWQGIGGIKLESAGFPATGVRLLRVVPRETTRPKHKPTAVTPDHTSSSIRKRGSSTLAPSVPSEAPTIYKPIRSVLLDSSGLPLTILQSDVRSSFNQRQPTTYPEGLQHYIHSRAVGPSHSLTLSLGF